MKWLISWWIFPALSSLVWLGMLMGMLIWWALLDNRQLIDMDANQHIAYISDVGALQLKTLFIAGSCITVIFLDIGFLAERWLRHTGRLARNTSATQKVLSIFAMIFGIVGAAGLILLSNFDTYRHPTLHDIFLVVFIGGYIISAIFLCAEYQRLGIHYRNHRVLAISFWIKLAFIVIEVVLAIAFACTSFTGHKNVAAVIEWAIAFIFTFWDLSFVIDLIPSVRTSKHIPQGHQDMLMAENGGHDPRFSQSSTRYEQNYTNDSAGPNQPTAKYVHERQDRGGLSKIFSNLR